ncbi:unnamed protein product [Ambrosiozyma monospora]|uniref:Unnamed protein product n=1 Tax=Ambrosiozyma monospora TaxID=43982 RepID=A0A9W6YS34_AMBMO|nr:unnamed protein product [Ambrosiozyma monospora]
MLRYTGVTLLRTLKVPSRNFNTSIFVKAPNNENIGSLVTDISTLYSRYDTPITFHNTIDQEIVDDFKQLIEEYDNFEPDDLFNASLTTQHEAKSIPKPPDVFAKESINGYANILTHYRYTTLPIDKKMLNQMIMELADSGVLEYNTFINLALYYSRENDIGNCLNIQSAMIRNGVIDGPSIDISNLVLKSMLHYGDDGHLERAKRLLRELKSLAVKPNFSTFMVLYNYLKSPSANNQMLELILEQKFDLQGYYKDIIRVKSKNKEPAEQIISFLKGIDDDYEVNCGNQLLKVCLQEKGFDFAWDQVERMKSLEKNTTKKLITTNTLNIFVNHFNSLGQPYFSLAMINYFKVTYGVFAAVGTNQMMLKYLLQLPNKQYYNWYLFAKYLHHSSFGDIDSRKRAELSNYCEKLHPKENLTSPLNEVEVAYHDEIQEKLKWIGSRPILNLDNNNEEFVSFVKKYFSKISKTF